jgi:hypothetical protein
MDLGFSLIKETKVKIGNKRQRVVFYQLIIKALEQIE